jgi:hypothetical protein
MSRRVGDNRTKRSHATLKRLNNVVEVLFHEINSVRLKTVKEDMQADRVSAAPRRELTIMGYDDCLLAWA